ncbi:hypothetical protein IKQ26_06265, partial [bacterium]|nr:hypothetical protein [bacterium]
MNKSAKEIDKAIDDMFTKMHTDMNQDLSQKYIRGGFTDESYMLTFIDYAKDHNADGICWSPSAYGDTNQKLFEVPETLKVNGVEMSGKDFLKQFETESNIRIENQNHEYGYNRYGEQAGKEVKNEFGYYGLAAAQAADVVLGEAVQYASRLIRSGKTSVRETEGIQVARIVNGTDVYVGGTLVTDESVRNKILKQYEKKIETSEKVITKYDEKGIIHRITHETSYENAVKIKENVYDMEFKVDAGVVEKVENQEMANVITRMGEASTVLQEINRLYGVSDRTLMLDGSNEEYVDFIDSLQNRSLNTVNVANKLAERDNLPEMQGKDGNVYHYITLSYRERADLVNDAQAALKQAEDTYNNLKSVHKAKVEEIKVLERNVQKIDGFKYEEKLKAAREEEKRLQDDIVKQEERIDKAKRFIGAFKLLESEINSEEFKKNLNEALGLNLDLKADLTLNSLIDIKSALMVKAAGARLTSDMFMNMSLSELKAKYGLDE